MTHVSSSGHNYCQSVPIQHRESSSNPCFMSSCGGGGVMRKDKGTSGARLQIISPISSSSEVCGGSVDEGDEMGNV